MLANDMGVWKLLHKGVPLCGNIDRAIKEVAADVANTDIMVDLRTTRGIAVLLQAP